MINTQKETKVEWEISEEELLVLIKLRSLGNNTVVLKTKNKTAIALKISKTKNDSCKPFGVKFMDLYGQLSNDDLCSFSIKLVSSNDERFQHNPGIVARLYRNKNGKIMLSIEALYGAKWLDFHKKMFNHNLPEQNTVCGNTEHQQEHMPSVNSNWLPNG